MAPSASFFHLRSQPGLAWPALPVPELAQAWAAYRELDRTQWMSAADVEANQLRQLRVVLEHCFEHIPYYRRRMEQAGLSPSRVERLDDYRRLPILTREAYRENFADLQARKLPEGVVAAGGSHTSGTNGVPLKILKSSRDALWWNALFLRDLEWCGLDPRGRVATLRLLAMDRKDLPQALEGLAFPSWSQFCSLLIESGPAYAMDVRQDPRRQLAWLREVDPDYLISLPSNLDFLASLVAESGRSLPRLKIIQSVGESLSQGQLERIERGFGVPVKNTYSSTEAGCAASPCPLEHGLHVHSESLLAEVLDEHDRPCRAGETGRLVFTTLHNFVAPLLRYDIMDEVTLAPGPCPCGRGLPLWIRVEGRRQPLMHLPGGGRRSVMGITLGVRRVGGVRQFQIIQKAVDHVVLRVVPDRDWTPEHADQMRHVVWDELGFVPRVDVQELEILERPAGGKLKIAIVEMDD